MIVTAICLALWLIVRPGLHGAAWLLTIAAVPAASWIRDRHTRRRLTARWEALTH